MPTYNMSKLPIPKSWEELEDITADILKLIWGDKFLTRNGRSGQRQNGIDIFGKPKELDGAYAGAQCRNKKIEIDEIDSVIKEAEKFKPLLKLLIFSVASPRDVTIHRHVREIDVSMLQKGKFSVRILFWDDICLLLSDHSELIEKHFPQFIEKQSSHDSIIKKIMESDVDDWLFDDHEGIHTFKKDTHLTIRRIDVEEPLDKFYEEWMDVFPDKKGYRVEYKIYYGNSFIKALTMIWVDGCRSCIPIPKFDSLKISKFQYAMGKIINCYHFQRFDFSGGLLNFDSYLKRAKITVDD